MNITDGMEWSFRIPSSDSHVSMNDGSDDENRCIKERVLFGPIQASKGQRVEIAILLMEEDGGTARPWMEIGTKLLVSSNEPILATIGSLSRFLVGFLDLEDSDDFLGSVGVIVDNNDGTIQADMRAGERSRQSSPSTMVFEGDGSSYEGKIIIR